MKNVSVHVGKLEVIKRLKSSVNGNPRYQVYVAGFHCVTAPDSSLGYSVRNYDGKEVKATIGTHYGVVTLQTVELVK